MAVAVVVVGLSACAGDPGTAGPAPAGPTPAKALASTFVIPGERLGVAGCPVFPRDHVFHADVRTLRATVGSTATIASIGTDRAVRPGFGALVWQGSRAGYPVNVVDPATAVPADFVTYYRSVEPSDPFDVPMPPDPRFEGWPGRAWDRHLLLVDPRTCETTELINVQLPGENIGARGHWYADAVVDIDLRSNEVPPAAVTVSGTSLLSGLVRHDEVASGRIDHVLGLTLPDTAPTSVWPARNSDGRSTEPAAPSIGSWFRLKPGADLSRLGPQARVVARALQDHGAVLVDTGPGPTVLGEPDLRWDDDDLATLGTLDMADFEVVDPTPMKVSEDSHRIR
jgi:hypothetical protein